jgi:hypothetical protein
MAQFTPFAPNVEVNGETVTSIVDGMGSFKSRGFDILTKNGIAQPEAGKWYSQQAWLASFKSIADTVGPTTLMAIGKKIPENAKFPPDINTIDKALAAIDVAYHMNHRSGGRQLFDPSTGRMSEGIGHYNFVKVNETKAKVICNNPYPCEFDKGIVEAMAKRFKPAGSMFVKVTHDDSCGCRKRGGDACTFVVEW